MLTVLAIASTRLAVTSVIIVVTGILLALGSGIARLQASTKALGTEAALFTVGLGIGAVFRIVLTG